MTLVEIDHEALKRFVALRRSTVSDTAVRRDLAFLSTVFTHAQTEMEGGPEANPLLTFSKRHLKENKREWFLTPAEFERLEKACLEEWHRVVVQVAVHTGMRHGELLVFEKGWINWDRGQHGEISIPKVVTKSKRPRVIPVLPELADTLDDWCARSPGPWLFASGNPPQPYTSFDGFFSRARDRAGLKVLRFHDLRHTFASWWVQRGGELMVLRDIMGHANMAMVERYAHLDSGATHRAVARLGRHTQDTTA